MHTERLFCLNLVDLQDKTKTARAEQSRRPSAVPEAQAAERVPLGARFCGKHVSMLELLCLPLLEVD